MDDLYAHEAPNGYPTDALRQECLMVFVMPKRPCSAPGMSYRPVQAPEK